VRTLADLDTTSRTARDTSSFVTADSRAGPPGEALLVVYALIVLPFAAGA
jgi:hypothetical protein